MTPHYNEHVNFFEMKLSVAFLFNQSICAGSGIISGTEVLRISSPLGIGEFYGCPSPPALEKALNVSLFQLYFVKLLAMSKIRVGEKGGGFCNVAIFFKFLSLYVCWMNVRLAPMICSQDCRLGSTPMTIAIRGLQRLGNNECLCAWLP